MDYAATQDFLYSLKNRGSRYGIDRMPPFMRELGHPEAGYPIVHVAGTNGKGSVCAMLEAVFRTAGYRTGLFTSPHLLRLGERVQVDRRILPEDAIVRYTEELKQAGARSSGGVPEMYPTFFEFMTGMGFLHFQREAVDVAVVEVGLGGRLDATNVITPAVSVITSIGLDHCDQLGDTLARVASEKAGIIKPGVPVVLGHIPPEAEEVILGIAKDRGCRVYRVADAFGDDLSSYPQCALEGDCQRINAATVVLTVRVLQERFTVPPASVEKGLQGVEWGGRWQRIRVGDRELILDATHNEDAARWLDRNLRALRERTGKKPVVITGTLGEGRARSLLEVVSRHAAEIRLLRANQPRATSFELLESILAHSFRGPVSRSSVPDLFPEPGVCTAGNEGDTVVLTGSIYLIGEVMERLQASAPIAETRLQD